MLKSTIFMYKNELPNKTEDNQQIRSIEEIMKAYGITDEYLDQAEKEVEEDYLLALEKWDKLVKEILGENHDQTTCLPVGKRDKNVIMV